MKIIAGAIKYAVLIIAIIALYQVGTSYLVYRDWYKVELGQSRDKVHTLLGRPKREWAQAEEDWWSNDILFGGIKLTVKYGGEACRSRHSACTVRGIQREYFTLWGNRWFLYFYLG